jgi:hypothetical protein
VEHKGGEINTRVVDSQLQELGALQVYWNATDSSLEVPGKDKIGTGF